LNAYGLFIKVDTQWILKVGTKLIHNSISTFYRLQNANERFIKVDRYTVDIESWY
jgi:hypothetical protein